jgi:hypothetical protein
MTTSSTRRQFLATASAGAALAFTAQSYARIVGANERISIGLIGCGGRGYGAFMPGVNARQAAERRVHGGQRSLVGAPRARGRACQEWYGRPARQLVSYRDILALDDIDAVMIASCDHHHAIHLEAAAKVKKDAYVEKPLAMDMESLKRAATRSPPAASWSRWGPKSAVFRPAPACRDLFRTGSWARCPGSSSAATARGPTGTRGCSAPSRSAKRMSTGRSS